MLPPEQLPETPPLHTPEELFRYEFSMSNTPWKNYLSRGSELRIIPPSKSTLNIVIAEFQHNPHTLIPSSWLSYGMDKGNELSLKKMAQYPVRFVFVPGEHGQSGEQFIVEFPTLFEQVSSDGDRQMRFDIGTMSIDLSPHQAISYYDFESRNGSNPFKHEKKYRKKKAAYADTQEVCEHIALMVHQATGGGFQLREDHIRRVLTTFREYSTQLDGFLADADARDVILDQNPSDLVAMLFEFCEVPAVNELNITDDELAVHFHLPVEVVKTKRRQLLSEYWDYNLNHLKEINTALRSHDQPYTWPELMALFGVPSLVCFKGEVGKIYPDQYHLQAFFEMNPRSVVELLTHKKINNEMAYEALRRLKRQYEIQLRNQKVLGKVEEIQGVVRLGGRVAGSLPVMVVGAFVGGYEGTKTAINALKNGNQPVTLPPPDIVIGHLIDPQDNQPLLGRGKEE